MKIRYLFSFAALAFIMAACSSDENTNETSGTNGQKMPFTATISLDQTTTRGLTDDGSNITTSWKENEQVALIHNGQIDKMSVTAVNNETKVATITGSISNATNGETVKVIYPASAVDEKAMVVKDDLLKTQDGLLTTIEEKLDYRTAETTLAVSSGGATFGAAVTLVLQHAIWKLSLTDGTNAISASQLVVKDGDNKELTTVKLSPAASSLYIAMAPANSVDMNFEATVGDDTYTYSKKGISLKAGKYYVSTMAMKAPEPGKMTVEATGYKNIYDTKPHGITVTVKDPATGATIMYGETEGSYNKTQSPTYTDVGKHTVYYQVTMDKYETVTGSADVEITQADATIGFANASVTITYGDAVPTNTLTNTGDGEVKYSTTATNVTVDESTGAVTVKGAGEATIKATVTDGTNYKYKDKEASYTLTVKTKTVAVTGVSLNKTSLDMKVGDSETLTATVAPSNATNQSVTWSSNKTSVATVDANGKVTAAGVGEATITVTTKDGSKTDTCNVTVKAKGSVEDYNTNDSNNW